MRVFFAALATALACSTAAFAQQGEFERAWDAYTRQQQQAASRDRAELERAREGRERSRQADRSLSQASQDMGEASRSALGVVHEQLAGSRERALADAVEVARSFGEAYNAMHDAVVDATEQRDRELQVEALERSVQSAERNIALSNAYVRAVTRQQRLAALGINNASVDIFAQVSRAYQRASSIGDQRTQAREQAAAAAAAAAQGSRGRGSGHEGDGAHGPREMGPHDTGSRDTGPRDTGPRDTGPRDTGPRDTGPRDTGPRDTGPRDTGRGGGGNDGPIIRGPP